MTPRTEAAELTRGAEVTPLELFFDLVFAFAVSQLSHHLWTHLSWRGVTETLVMLLTILTVWAYTSWAATVIRADSSGTRWMVLAVMLLGLFMNASVTAAFTTSGWLFVVPLLTIQLGRTVWTIASAPNTMYRKHYRRVLVWLCGTAPLWVTGAILGTEARLWWWSGATVIELVGTFLAHPVPGQWLRSENEAFDAGHMLERCRLFLLIALGETVLTTGSALSGAKLEGITLLTGTSALVDTTALWALTFGTSHRLVARHVEESTNPIRASRYAVNALTMMVTGLIAVAVAHEEIIAHPFGSTSTALVLLLAGGPFLFIAVQGSYLLAVPKVRSKFHVVAGTSLLMTGAIALMVPPYAALALVSTLLTAIAIADARRCQE